MCVCVCVCVCFLVYQDNSFLSSSSIILIDFECHKWFFFVGDFLVCSGKFDNERLILLSSSTVVVP